jgi:hypothetical protein
MLHDNVARFYKLAFEGSAPADDIGKIAQVEASEMKNLSRQY